MESKYVYAIKIGIIYGIFVSIIATINTLLNTLDLLTSLLSPIPILFIYLIVLIILGISGFLLLLYIGYHVVHHSIAFIKSKKDAIILSASAGAISGIMSGFVQLNLRTVIPYIFYHLNGSFSSYEAFTLTTSLINMAEFTGIAAIISALGGLYCLSKKRT